MEVVFIIVIAFLAVALMITAFFLYKTHKGKSITKPDAEIDKDKLDTLVKYVSAQKEEAEEKQKLKELKTAEQKEKLERFKQTREELKESLKSQLDKKEWLSLESVLKKADKGNMGIYVLFNETKNKYYIGQSKELFARIKKHFEVEQIATDYMKGDVIKVKILNASELDSDYRIDHIEKTGIELFDSSNSGYNKTNGNL